MRSSYVWAHSSYLSLALPIAVPATSIFSLIISAIVIPLTAITRTKRSNNATVVYWIASYLLTLVPVILLTVALIFAIPSPLSSCSLESQWLHLFRTRNADAIRTIQDSLRCCGLNSLHDRAWPFPSKGIDAGECERTQGWTVRCLDGWREQQVKSVSLIAVACVANLTFVVSNLGHARCSMVAYF